MFDKARDWIARAISPDTENVWAAATWENKTGKIRNNNMRSMLKAFTGDVYMLVDYKATVMSTVEGHVKSLQGDTFEIVPAHIWNDTMAAVNEVHTRSNLLYITATHLELAGNAYWYIVKNNLGVPAELYPILPQHMKIVPAEDKIIAGYIYEKDRKKIAFAPDEIAHFKLPNPVDPYYYGMGPLQAATMVVNTLDSIEKYQKAVFDNMGSPSLHATISEEFKKLLTNKKRRDEFKEEFRAAFQGVKKAGGVVISPAIESLTQFVNAKEVGYLATDESLRKKLANIFRVPLSLLFDQTGALGRSAIEADLFRFHKDGIQPRLKVIAEVITERIMSLYDANIIYEFVETTPQDKQFELVKTQTYLNAFVITINEVREAEGKDPVSWGYVPVAPFSMAPLQGATAPAELSTDPTPGPLSITGKDPKQLEAPEKTRVFKPEITQKLREQYWSAFTKQGDKIEKKWAGDLSGMFKDHEKIVLKNLKDLHNKSAAGITKATADFIMISEDTAAVDMWAMSKPSINNGLATGVSLAEAKIGQLDTIANPDEHFRSFIAEKELLIKTVPAADYHGQIRAAIQGGIESGQSYEEMRDTIKVAYGDYTDPGLDFKTMRIVRTETTQAVNNGQLESVKESGLAAVKVWMAELDDVVRATHAQAHGQERQLNEEFTVGGFSAPYPGATGDPGEDINCRCDQAFGNYVVEE